MRNFFAIIMLIVAVLVIILITPDYISSSFNSTIRDALISPLAQIKRKTDAMLGDRALIKPDDLARLTVELEQLKLENRQLQALAEENEELRGMLDYKKRCNYKLLAAQVVERNVNNWWQMIRIDKGTRSGIRKDMPVITTDGLVGRIHSVSIQTADVLLIIDPQLKISARISHSDIYGIARGNSTTLRGDPQCIMDFISREATIKTGDEVISSGFGAIFPEGFVIGYVEDAIMDESGLFKSAKIVPAVDFKNIRRVFVVLK